MPTFSRQELYDLVWSEPMRTLSTRFEMSDVGLKKHCLNMEVPVPERGYWAKLQAGKVVLRTKLSPGGPGMPDRVTIGTDPQHRWPYDPAAILAEPAPFEPTFAEPIEAVRKRVARRVGRVRRERDLASPHPSIRTLLEVDDKRRAQQRQSPVLSQYYAPYFDSPFEQRRRRLTDWHRRSRERGTSKSDVPVRHAEPWGWFMSKAKARKRAGLAEAQNWRCAYCAGVMELHGHGPQAATIEHVVPRSRRGTDARDNLIAACQGCNGARGPHHSAMRFHRLRRLLLARGRWPQCEHPSRPVAKWLRGLAVPRSGVEVVRFTHDEVVAHVEQHHPGCPEYLRQELARAVATRAWARASVGMAFGIIATEYIRKAFTDYRKLRKIPGMTDLEARLIVRPEVNDVLRGWGSQAEVEAERG